MLRLIKSDTDLNQFRASIPGPVGIKGLFFTIEGTNDAGLTLASYSVGRMYVNGYGGRQLVGVDFDMMQAVNNLWYGNAPWASAAGAAVAAGVYIPRGYRDDNIEFIEREDNFSFRIDFLPGFNTALASATMRLYADIDIGISSYQLSIAQQNMSEAAAGTFPTVFNHENIILAYLGDRPTAGQTLTLTGTNLSRLQTIVGSLTGNAEINDVIRYTNCLRMLESETKYIAEIYKGDGDINSRIEDKIECTFTATGAVNLELALMGMNFNPDKLVISDANSNNALVRNIDQKRLGGKVRTAGALEPLLVAKTS